MGKSFSIPIISTSEYAFSMSWLLMRNAMSHSPNYLLNFFFLNMYGDDWDMVMRMRPSISHCLGMRMSNSLTVHSATWSRSLNISKSARHFFFKVSSQIICHHHMKLIIFENVSSTHRMVTNYLESNFSKKKFWKPVWDLFVS